MRTDEDKGIVIDAQFFAATFEGKVGDMLESDHEANSIHIEVLGCAQGEAIAGLGIDQAPSFADQRARIPIKGAKLLENGTQALIRQTGGAIVM